MTFRVLRGRVGTPTPSVLKKALTPSAPSAVTRTSQAITRSPTAHTLKGPSEVYLDRHGYLDSVACQKKYFLDHVLPQVSELSLSRPSRKPVQLSSDEGIADIIRLQDGLEFRELCLRWDAVSVHPNVNLIRESDFEAAHIHTVKVVNDYFATTFASLQRGAPPLILHRPAIRALIEADVSGDKQNHPSDTTNIVEARARPLILHFYPKTLEWRVYISTPSTDAETDKFRANKLADSILFDLFVLSRWSCSTGLLSDTAKQYLDIQQFQAPPAGPRSHNLTPFVDPEKSAALTIRPYIGGPLTLTHHDTYTLMQFVVKTSLASLVVSSGRSATSGDDDDGEEGDGDKMNAPQKRRSKKGSQHGSPASTVSVATSILRDGEIFRNIQHAVKLLVSAKQGKSSDGTLLAPLSAMATDGNVGTDFGAYLSPQCSKLHCSHFSRGKCLPIATTGGPVPIFDFPSFRMDRKLALWRAGVDNSNDLITSKPAPAVTSLLAKKGSAALVSKPLERLCVAAKYNQPIVNPAGFAQWIGGIKYPAFFLDFEAVSFALPPFERSKPYQALPFQFSLDVFHTDILTETPKHYDFLFVEEPGCKPFEDPRALCVTRLMEAIRTERAIAKQRMEHASQPAAGDPTALTSSSSSTMTGKRKHIIGGNIKSVYKGENRTMTIHPWDGVIVAHFAGFESKALQYASHILPQFQTEIANLTFMDTIDLCKASLIHPATRGSTSLKKLVPALLTDKEQYAAFKSNLNSSGAEVEEAADGSAAAALYRLWRNKATADMLLVDELQARKADAEKLGWASIRNQLLDYCNADTRNMWLVVRAIHNLIVENQQRGCQYDSDGWSVPSGVCVAQQPTKAVSTPSPVSRAPRKRTSKRA